MDAIRDMFYAMPGIVQIGFAALIATFIFTLLLYGLAAAGLKEARELIEALKKEPDFKMTEEAKGELFAWITIMMLGVLSVISVINGSIDQLIGGLVVWITITILVLTAWALRQKGK